MSTPQKPQQPATPKSAATPGSTPRSSYKAANTKKAPEFLFGRENYMLMLAGIALIFIGFLLMSGGKSANPHEFNYSEIYSFRRITLAPIVVLLGFAVEAYAIMKKPKDTTPTETAT
jgi:hypothetical protein